MANYTDPVIRCLKRFRDADYYYPQDQEITSPEEPDISEEEKREQARLYYKQVREEKRARGKK